MKRITVLISAIALLLFACYKEEFHYDPYLVSTYQQFLENLILDCPADTNQYYFKGIINDYQTCYYNSVDGRILSADIYSKFTTPGPSFNTGDPISDLRIGLIISLPHYPYRQGADYIKISFPDVSGNVDKVEYLDSIFAIKNYRVKSGTGYETTNLNINENKFNITLEMIDLSKDGNGGNVFIISSQFGSQEDSFVKIIKADKSIENGEVYYSIMLQLECNLYHWPQYGKKGLWGKVKSGILAAKFKVK